VHYAHEPRRPPSHLARQRPLAVDGQPKVADFGLAKLLGGNETLLTNTGDLLGTPCYMAPEQVGGKPRDISPLADVHALGAILYEALTGQPPFQGATRMETLEQVRTQEPVPPALLCRAVPRAVEAVCLKCLEKDPQDRYPSAAALADDLRKFLADEPVAAMPRDELGWAIRWARGAGYEILRLLGRGSKGLCTRRQVGLARVVAQDDAVGPAAGPQGVGHSVPRHRRLPNSGIPTSCRSTTWGSGITALLLNGTRGRG
jgi:hypothetical protein